MYSLLWNGKEVIEYDIESYSEASELRSEYLLAYGGVITILSENY